MRPSDIIPGILFQMNKEQQMALVPAIAQMHSSVHGIGKDNVMIQVSVRIENQC